MTQYDVTVEVTYRVDQPSVETAMARSRELIQFDQGREIDLTQEGICGHEVTGVVKVK